MKNNCTFYSILLLSTFLLISNTALAQSEKKSKGLFVDWDISLMLADDDFMGHATLASGYRFNEKMAAGIEWRAASKFSCCNNFSINGLGATYRFTNKWFLGKVSLGKVLRAARGDDFGSDWQYKKGGHYYSVSLAYRLRPGFLFGLSHTGARNNKFDYYIEDFNTGELSYDREETMRFGTIGIMFGAAFPGRGRK